MHTINPERLLQAAKTSTAIITMVHEIIWSLFPDELIALAENPERQMIQLLVEALDRKTELNGDNSIPW